VTNRGEPAYQVLSRELRTRILQGDFSNGQQLPTEAELSARYQVSRQTVRRAFQELVAQDMVYRVPGRGTFARPGRHGYVRQFGSVDDLIGLSEDTQMEVIRPLARRVDLISAGRLRLPSDVVCALELVRLHEGTRFCTTKVMLPPPVAALLASVTELSVAGSVAALTIIGLLDARLPVPIAEAQQSITVDRVSEADAATLGCAPGSPALRIDRLYLDMRGEAVELAVSHFLPEHYSYRISLRRNG
jgi:DNA-binding GntR family transcriptional regulator